MFNHLKQIVMITGKNSALKGFALLFWAVCIIVALIGCITTGTWICIIAAVIASAMNGWALYDVWTMWSEEKSNK